MTAGQKIILLLAEISEEAGAATNTVPIGVFDDPTAAKNAIEFFRARYPAKKVAIHEYWNMMNATILFHF